MAILLNPYLTFDGTAREAMEFYQSVLGGDLEVTTFAAFSPDAPFADKVMHARLTTAEGFTLMASDPPPQEGYQAATGVTISLSGDDAAKLRGYFDGLADGGTVYLPLEKQMWGDVFGQLTDKFGIGWMVNIAGDTA